MSAIQKTVIPTWDSAIPRHLDVESVLKATENAWVLITGSSVPGMSKITAYVMLFAGLTIGAYYLLALAMRAATLLDSVASRWDINLGERSPVRHSRQNFCSILLNHIQALNIAEAWSDRRFAELEAEVVADGGYYDSVLGRLLKRPSFGQRKVARLIDAIHNSTEDRILLIGEPGSGKSVAMRHLAVQLAAQAKRARRTYRIPLYVNLRELPDPPADGPTAMYIADFIRDYAARDMISGDFIRAHWDEYVRDGNWFFLLDSFDEIPAVMHAGAHSDVIEQYTAAIRRCLESMVKCGAVVASREYKAPSQTAWKRFRILALSPDLQEQLIARSLIEAHDTRAMVKRYVARSNSAVFKNPMFLTLLCEDMKRENKEPASDFDLLIRHVNKLLKENARKLGSTYRVSETELTSVTTRMATALTTNFSLGLAPTFNQLCKELCTSFMDHERLQVVLNALVWMKVLRSDVVQAQPGDRRYAFFHRRYQEAVVVDQLARGKLTVAASTLLRDDGWREYAVTLLQSQEEPVIRPFVDEAIALLPLLASEITPVSGRFGSESVQHYNLENSGLVTLLKLLQEGLRDRFDLRSDGLAIAVSAALRPFWEEGDLVNQHTVLSVSGLSKVADLEQRIRSVISEPSEVLRREAFIQLSYMKYVPIDLAMWLRDTLANEILDAKTRPELRRVEALVTRLPIRIQANIVWKRCMRLRRPIAFATPFVVPVRTLMRFGRRAYEAVILRKINVDQSEFVEHNSLNRSVFKVAMFCASVTLFYFSLYVGLEFASKHNSNMIAPLFVGLAWTYIARSCISFRFRGSAACLSPIELGMIATRWYSGIRGTLAKSIISFITWTLGFMTCVLIVGLILLNVSKWLGIPIGTIFVALYAAAVAIGGIVWICSIVSKKRSIAKMRTLMAARFPGSGQAIGEVLIHARNVIEVRRWLREAGNELLVTDDVKRAFVTWALARSQQQDWRSGATEQRLREIAWSQAESCIQNNRPSN